MFSASLVAGFGINVQLEDWSFPVVQTPSKNNLAVPPRKFWRRCNRSVKLLSYGTLYTDAIMPEDDSRKS